MNPSTNHLFNVLDYGATRNSEGLQTGHLQAALDACFESGGGTVYVPPGLYVTGTLVLKSNTTLYLEQGAVIRGSADLTQYPVLPYTSERRNTALFYAEKERNITICGGGCIDGNGDAFFETDRPVEETDYDATWTRQGAAFFEKPYGVEDGPIAPKREAGRDLRPGNLILMINCENVAGRDCSLIGSPNWCLHLAGCRYVHLRGMTIRNSLLIPNTDCIDISTSQHVTISDCIMEAGDDGIAISPCGDGYFLADAENITVTNCTIISRSSAIRIGPSGGNIRNCVFSNLIIHSSNRALGLFLRHEETIENIVFSNIVIETRLHTGWWGKAEPIHISSVLGYYEEAAQLGALRNVRFTNITARCENGIVIYGVDHPDGKMHLEDISIDGMRLELSAGPLAERFGGNLDLRPANNPRHAVFKHDVPGLLARNVKGLSISNFQLRWSGEFPEFYTHGISCENIDGLRIDDFRGRACHSSHAAIRLRGGRELVVQNCVSDAAAPFVETDNEQAALLLHCKTKA